MKELVSMGKVVVRKRGKGSFFVLSFFLSTCSPLLTRLTYQPVSKRTVRALRPMISRGVSSDEKPSETLQPAWAYQLAGRQAGGGGIPKRHGLETLPIEHGELQESHY